MGLVMRTDIGKPIRPTTGRQHGTGEAFMTNIGTHPRVISALVLLLSVIAFQAPVRADSMPQAEFEQRVRDYLLAHPEVVVEALQAYDARQRQAQEDQIRAVLVERADEILRDPVSPVGGNAQGKTSPWSSSSTIIVRTAGR
jgi:hypothetical protein